MGLKHIKSYNELNNYLKQSERVLLLLYKKGSEQSDCAIKNLAEVNENNRTKILAADVGIVRDIHEKYGIRSAPSMLDFKHQKLSNTYKGCHTKDFFQSVVEQNAFIAVGDSEVKPQKRVTVYSTPTCSWCTTLKNYLNENRIKYTDIDVSKDQAAAEAMVKKSGQQGVPQTDINGEMIIGYDKKRIDQLLGIH